MELSITMNSLKNYHKRNEANKGFTLIELLIVVAIVGILAQIAYASYLTSIQQSYRYDIQQDMVEISQQLERHYSRNGVYTGSTATPGDFTNDRYTVSFNPALADGSFTISAKPKANSGQSSDDCGTLTLNHLGAKTATGSGSGCWR